MGKSASGKDRIYSVLAGDRELNFRKLILYTTRPIRAGEENGVQYYFTDENKRKEFQEKGLLIESRSYDRFMVSGHILQQMTDRSIWIREITWESELWNLIIK